MYKFAHQASRKSFTSGVSDKNGDTWLIYRTLCDFESKTSREINDFFKNGGALLATSSGHHAARKARRGMGEMKAEKAQRKADKDKEKAQEEKAQEGKEKGPDNNRRSPKPVHQEKSVQGTPDATMGAPASALGSRLAGNRTSARNLKCSYCCTRGKEEVRGAAGECKGEVDPQSTDGAPGGGQRVDVGGPSAFSVGLPTSIVKAQSKEQAEEVDGKKTVMPVDIDQAMAVSRG
ncbi:hypothetical protein CCMSSC00406_0009807 [Pleurotus cornucopiae]|uniref:Uncharacterized protein n=1 Tax=Pleurotus cornucopiae TaxID=5321 RepID=A0ACB7IIC1_PLECO|nr:hypothetical protein CCMSSC00406_0009807 [Pleurotus cornucopiae]